MKLVKVARVGGKVIEVAVPDNATITQCLAAAGISLEQNEDVYENHQLMNGSTNALKNAIVIVETRKAIPLSHGLVRFINHLIDEDIFENYEDYEDDDCEIDLNELYKDNKEFIDILISKAKEA